jgi:Spy/CpxP family protein refolding chaperone
MRKFHRAALAVAVAVLVCFAVVAAHVWQAHGSGIARARHHASSLPIAD